jgi:hypothetical protein
MRSAVLTHSTSSDKSLRPAHTVYSVAAAQQQQPGLDYRRPGGHGGQRRDVRIRGRWAGEGLADLRTQWCSPIAMAAGPSAAEIAANMRRRLQRAASPEQQPSMEVEVEEVKGSELGHLAAPTTRPGAETGVPGKTRANPESSWVAYSAEDGGYYYYNTATQDTVWDEPAEGVSMYVDDEEGDQDPGLRAESATGSAGAELTQPEPVLQRKPEPEPGPGSLPLPEPEPEPERQEVPTAMAAAPTTAEAAPSLETTWPVHGTEPAPLGLVPEPVPEAVPTRELTSRRAVMPVTQPAPAQPSPAPSPAPDLPTVQSSQATVHGVPAATVRPLPLQVQAQEEHLLVTAAAAGAGRAAAAATGPYGRSATADVGAAAAAAAAESVAAEMRAVASRQASTWADVSGGVRRPLSDASRRLMLDGDVAAAGADTEPRWLSQGGGLSRRVGGVGGGGGDADGQSYSVRELEMDRARLRTQNSVLADRLLLAEAALSAVTLASEHERAQTLAIQRGKSVRAQPSPTRQARWDAVPCRAGLSF